MNRTLPTVVIVIVVLGLCALMWRSWRRRSRRDAGLEAGYALPPNPGRVLAGTSALYVATTPRDRPLERLAIRGLGFRSRAELTVTSAGVVLGIPGQERVFIPGHSVERLTRATWTIDRVVETDGLLVLGWRLRVSDTASQSDTANQSGSADAPGNDGALSVDSYFRITDPAARGPVVDAIRSLAPGAFASGDTTESEA